MTAHSPILPVTAADIDAAAATLAPVAVRTPLLPAPVLSAQFQANVFVKPEVLQATADAFDANFKNGDRLFNDDQLRRILHARQWGPDKLRTCKPAPLQSIGAGPYIAIHMQLITRKSLGGLKTDLQSRVLDAAGAPIPGAPGAR